MLCRESNRTQSEKLILRAIKTHRRKMMKKRGDRVLSNDLLSLTEADVRVDLDIVGKLRRRGLL